jgi:hypothetical protein
MWSVQNGYKEEFIWEKSVEFRDAACQDMSLGAVAESWQERN